MFKLGYISEQENGGEKKITQSVFSPVNVARGGLQAEGVGNLPNWFLPSFVGDITWLKISCWYYTQPHL